MDTDIKDKRRQSPRERASIWSILTFWYTVETFKMGFSKDIEQRDLYAPLLEHKSDHLGDALERAWNEEVYHCSTSKSKTKKIPSLWKAIVKVFGAQLALYGLVLAAMEFLIRLQQPLFLGLLLKYFSANNVTNVSIGPEGEKLRYFNRLMSYYRADQPPLTPGEAYFFACGVIFCSFLNVFVQHPYMMAIMHLGMKIRVAACSLIYRKALRLSQRAMAESNAGQVVNLLANDVNRLDTGPLFMHYLWIGPLETIIMTAYLYKEMGMPAVYGAVLILSVVPFQSFLGWMTARLRRETAQRTDERVRLMNEIITGIEVIKMYTWENSFQEIIDHARRREIAIIRMTSFIKGIVMSFIMFTSRLGIFFTVLTYVLFVGNITAEKVFFVTGYYNIMKQTMTLYFPQGTGQVAEMHVAIQRIRDYLLSEETLRHQRPRVLPLRKARVPSTGKKVTIADFSRLRKREQSFSSQSSNDSEAQPKPIRRILKEREDPDFQMLPSVDSNTRRSHSVIFTSAYCKWLSGSQQDDLADINLKVISASLCTIIGPVGAGKSSILLAALEELPSRLGTVKVYGSVSYASQEPWLFASSVRQNILFGEKFIRNRYQQVCRVCALERDISLFPHGDKTIVGERGVSLSGGQRARINLARAVYKQADIYFLDDPLSAVDTQVGKQLFEECISKYLADKTVILVTHQLQFLKTVDHIVIMDHGSIVAQGNFASLKNSGLDIVKLLEDKATDAVIDVEDEVEKERLMNLVKTISMQSMINTFDSKIRSSTGSWGTARRTSITPHQEAEMQSSGRVNAQVYYDYFGAGGGISSFLLVIMLFVAAQLWASAGDFFLSHWTGIEDKLNYATLQSEAIVWAGSGLTRAKCVVIFSVITVATIVVALVRAFYFFIVCMRASIRLHDKMFQSISNTSMYFFNTNTSGRILNRFSKDMGAVDELLPQAMIDCAQIMLNLAGVVLVVLLVDYYMLLVPTLIVFLTFWSLRVIYIRTTSSVKRLEGITRSPVFAHLNASLQGLTTIRACNMETTLAVEFDRHQDLHSSSWYIFITCSRAFGFWLDVVCLFFIIAVTLSFVISASHSLDKGHQVGLAITQSISLTGIFQWGMRQSAEMENQMTSVERILEYTALPTEPRPALDPPKVPSEDWPQEGRLQFKGVNLRYGRADPPVLTNISVEIEPKNKIGIVGRTGAGKSSIIQALFRLALVEGQILIDGINTADLELKNLRRKLSIIPQEPVLFSGTMRKNLDPFGEYPDSVLIDALEEVELKHVIDESLGGLKCIISEGGSNFSVGQRQLVCLARAIVRNNRILILDEATANVDAQTDLLIQTTIRQKFADCTVLTIAHRLNTIIDADMVLVMDAGNMVEFDHPYKLLQKKNGVFTKMAKQTGEHMVANLTELATESYKKRENKNGSAKGGPQKSSK